MRWRDSSGVRWRLRRQRLAWRARIRPGAAFDILPTGIGDVSGMDSDPVSFVIGLICLIPAIPFLILFALLLAAWLVELAARLLATPAAVVLRLTGTLPYRLDLYRNGHHHGTHAPRGRPELVRLRAALTGLHRSCTVAGVGAGHGGEAVHVHGRGGGA